MGCFNYRCAVSNGNILPRDEVAVIFFGMGGYRSHLLMPVFFAEYNDYGWFENIAPETEKEFLTARKIISEWYHAGYCTSDRTSSRDNLPAVDKKCTDLLDEDQFCSVFREYAVHQNHPQGMFPNRVNYMMIHRSIYEDMISNYKTVKNWRGKTIYDDIKTSMTPPPYLEHMKVSIPADADPVIRSIASFAAVLASDSAVEMATNLAGNAGTAMDDYKHMIHRMKDILTHEEQIEHIAKLAIFEMKMDQYHIPWVESGSTDQEYTYKDGIKYHEMCLKHLKQKQADWDKDRDWEDEEEEDEE